MDLSSDNFEYIFQLTKVLSSECRANRQERDKLDILLKRLAKQSGVSYDELSGSVKPESHERYDKLAKPTEIDQLISENYELVYQVELQEYINRKILMLIAEITEHLNSIRGFVIERKLTGLQNIDNYLDERFNARNQRLMMNLKFLRQTKECTEEKLEIICQELKLLIDEIDWSCILKSSMAYKDFIEKITFVETNYGIKFLDEKTIES